MAKGESKWAARWDPSTPLDLAAVPFGWTDEGYRDFRGVPVNRYRKVLGRRFMKFDLGEADFSGLDLKGLEFVDCRFTATNFASFNDRGNDFIGCVFTGCSFRDAYLGMRPRRRAGPSRYEDCVFTGNDFKNAFFDNAVFRRTVFDGNRMKGLDFSASGFRDCRFVGRVEDVWFRGGYPVPEHYRTFGRPVEPGLHGVDFSRATLFMVAISDGCALDGLTLPADGSCALVDKSRMLAEEISFAAGFGADAALVAKLVDWLTVYTRPNDLSTPQETGILCRADLEAFLSGFTERSAELADTVFDRAVARYGLNNG